LNGRVSLYVVLRTAWERAVVALVLHLLSSLSTMSNGAHSPNIARDAGYTPSRVLDDIKTATNCISHATTQ